MSGGTSIKGAVYEPVTEHIDYYVTDGVGHYLFRTPGSKKIVSHNADEYDRALQMARELAEQAA